MRTNYNDDLIRDLIEQNSLISSLYRDMHNAMWCIKEHKNPNLAVDILEGAIAGLGRIEKIAKFVLNEK